MRDTDTLWPRMIVTEVWAGDDWNVMARASLGGHEVSVVSVQFYNPGDRDKDISPKPVKVKVSQKTCEFEPA